MLPSILRFLGGLILATALQACDGPCEELAEVICGCEQSQQAEDQCVEQVRATMQSRDPSDPENARCDALLDSCQGPADAPDPDEARCDLLMSDDGATKCGFSKG